MDETVESTGQAIVCMSLSGCVEAGTTLRRARQPPAAEPAAAGPAGRLCQTSRRLCGAGPALSVIKAARRRSAKGDPCAEPSSLGVSAGE